MIESDSTKSGIYCITNQNNGKVYIGSALNIKKRLIKHRRDLLKNKHHSRYLQNSYNKYGEEIFITEILEYTDKNNLLVQEQFYLNEILKANINSNFFNMNGYNIARIAGSNKGIKRSKETKEKISNSLKGKESWSRGLTAESDIRLYNKGLKARGKTHSDKTKAKISKKVKGSNNPMFGKKHKYNSFKSQCKEILQFSLTGELIKEWSSMIEIERTLGYFQSNISAVCNGRKKTYKKYIWKFKNK